MEHILDPIKLSALLLISGVSFMILFVLCELTQIITDEFASFNDELNQFAWYSFPIKMQQILIIVMANAQQPTVIRGFGNILCTR